MRLVQLVNIFTLCAGGAFLLSIYSCKGPVGIRGAKLLHRSSDTLEIEKTITSIRKISGDLFEVGSFKNTGIEIKYRLLKPNQTGAQKIPLVIVFHGSGAIGDDNSSQLGVLANMWAQPDIMKKYPAYVLAPQFPSRSSNYVKDKKRGVLVSIPQPCLTTAIALIDSLKRVLNIDKRRIYVIGFSMGGSTVINALSMRPDLFAAGISLSGIPQFDHPDQLTRIPIWLIHGNADTENPIDSDIQFYNELKENGNVKFWIYDGVGHDEILKSGIVGEELVRWIYKQ